MYHLYLHSFTTIILKDLNEMYTHYSEKQQNCVMWGFSIRDEKYSPPEGNNQDRPIPCCSKWVKKVRTISENQKNEGIMGHCKPDFLDRFVWSALLTWWFCILSVSICVLWKKLPHSYRFWFWHHVVTRNVLQK